MNNAVLMVVYNNLELTKAAVASVLAQDIPVELWFVDNGSTDGTWDWVMNDLTARPLPVGSMIHRARIEQNKSPVAVVNAYFGAVFNSNDYDYILGVPNDVVLPTNFYRELLRWPRGIVTASQTDESAFATLSESRVVSTNTPMAVGLVRRWVYDALIAKDGYFLDPGFFHYASDCCLALRLAACGITGIQLDMPYYHYCSAALRLASPESARKQHFLADKDRAYFQRKYGFAVDSPKYAEVCGDINFRAEPGGR